MTDRRVVMHRVFPVKVVLSIKSPDIILFAVAQPDQIAQFSDKRFVLSRSKLITQDLTFCGLAWTNIHHADLFQVHNGHSVHDCNGPTCLVVHLQRHRLCVSEIEELRLQKSGAQRWTRFAVGQLDLEPVGRRGSAHHNNGFICFLVRTDGENGVLRDPALCLIVFLRAQSWLHHERWVQVRLAVRKPVDGFIVHLVLCVVESKHCQVFGDELDHLVSVIHGQFQKPAANGTIRHRGEEQQKLLADLKRLSRGQFVQSRVGEIDIVLFLLLERILRILDVFERNGKDTLVFLDGEIGK
ncbi:hypothetical protein OGAPHI_003283 [Ogataea philodendri]|uniref:Uncharacterized protein n=1 Tax=Ogataea philodendri TaxID=1378263 RepID=A0A9P8P8D3_9ASCO|nr:uncharacterized protein OGAPHI_003283 [Ogataea philodendri]KAH3666834.1 hypothetical protein OGAPHI_003283 [Ogataea philodendri]